MVASSFSSDAPEVVGNLGPVAGDHSREAVVGQGRGRSLPSRPVIVPRGDERVDDGLLRGLDDCVEQGVDERLVFDRSDPSYKFGCGDGTRLVVVAGCSPVANVMYRLLLLCQLLVLLGPGYVVVGALGEVVDIRVEQGCVGRDDDDDRAGTARLLFTQFAGAPSQGLGTTLTLDIRADRHAGDLGRARGRSRPGRARPPYDRWAPTGAVERRSDSALKRHTMPVPPPTPPSATGPRLAPGGGAEVGGLTWKPSMSFRSS